MAYRNVCPEDLRFTQDSIAIKFKPPYQHLRIDNAVDQIRKRELSPTVFSPLNVVHHKNILWSLDNRRLWVLRKAGVATVEIKLVPLNFIKRSSEFFSSLDPLLENRYSSPLYFPVVRGRVRFVFTPPPPPVRVRVPVRVHVPVRVPASLVSPLPNISQQPTKNSGHGGGGKEEPSLWRKVVDALKSFNLGGRGGFGRNALLAVAFCVVARQAYNSKFINECPEKAFPRGNNGGAGENVGALHLIVQKAVASMGRLVINLSGFCLNEMFCFLRFLVRHGFDLGKVVAVSLGGKALSACGVCFRCLHLMASQAVVCLGRMVLHVSQFCLKKLLELL